MKEKDKRYFAYFIDILDEGDVVVKAGTPLEYISHEHYTYEGAPSKDNIPEAMSIEFNRVSRVGNQSFMVCQSILGTHYKPIQKCVEISKELALELARSLDTEYYEKEEYRKGWKKRAIKFILNLFLFPFNLMYDTNCGELIAEEIY